MPTLRDEIVVRRTRVNTYEPGSWPGRSACRVRALVMHVMDGTWDGSIGWAQNPASKASFNFGIAKDGRIAEVVDPDTQAPWANGIVNSDDTDLPAHLHDLLSMQVNANWVTISIELEGKPAQEDFPTSAQLSAATRLAAWLCQRYGLTPTLETILPHRAFSTRERPHCPGPRLDLPQLVAAIHQELAGLQPDHPEPQPGHPEPLNGERPLLAPPSATAAQAQAYLVGRGSVYTPHDLGVIVDHYWKHATRGGLDPALALAQCVLETSQQQPDGRWWVLSSWWAQRPRRNPAGLGVTGETQSDPPANPQGWERDEEKGVFRRGLAFTNWEIAVQAHVGRLLAYALTDEQATPIQREMITVALAFRPLPANLRGVAPRLNGLNGRWAVPGHDYGDHIARLANEIAGQSRSMPATPQSRRRRAPAATTGDGSAAGGRTRHQASSEAPATNRRKAVAKAQPGAKPQAAAETPPSAPSRSRRRPSA